MTALSDVVSDARHALRTMARQPAMTAVAVLTLALGIGANTAVFSVVRAVLLAPLPFADVDRVVRVAESREDELAFLQTSMPNYLDWRDNNVFSAMAGYFVGQGIDTGREFAERISVVRVTPELFDVVGMQPMLGRTFRPEEWQAEARVVILSHAYWRRALGADSGAVGTQVRLDDGPYTVVGVMGPETGAVLPFSREMLTPMPDATRPLWRRGVRFLYVIGRLAPGVTVDQARDAMGTIGDRLAADFPDANEGRRVVVAPVIDAMVGDVRRPLLLISGAVGVVLLIGCANVASLLLARATSRRTEFAVRTAVGATRVRLLRQAMSESLLLGLIGGGAGLAVAAGLQRLLVVLGPRDVPRLADATLNGTVLMATFAVSLAAAVIFGLAPALRASLASPQSAFRTKGVTRSRAGALRFLIAAEVALTLVLLVGGGLFIASFAKLVRVDPGYVASDVLAMRITLPSSRYPDAQARVRFYDELTERVERLPGVQSAGVSALSVLTSSSFGAEITTGGSDEGVRGTIWRVMPGYFRTLRIDQIAGRRFTADDGIDGPPVAILGASTARRLFGSDDPLGRFVTFTSHLRPDEGPRQVVGVVGDVRSFGLDRDVPVQLYIPFTQWAGANGHLALRVAGDPSAYVTSVRREIAALDDNLPVQNIATLEDQLVESVRHPRFYTVFLTAFALVAVIMAAGGVYGVLAYAVNQRTREIGIRMALGARRSDVLRLVIRDGMAPAAAGAAIGLAVATASHRLLQDQLFEISGADPRIAALATAVIVAVALTACAIPARRAGRVNPVETLQAE